MPAPWAFGGLVRVGGRRGGGGPGRGLQGRGRPGGRGGWGRGLGVRARPPLRPGQCLNPAGHLMGFGGGGVVRGSGMGLQALAGLSPWGPGGGGGDG